MNLNNQNRRRFALILAAGEGKRMKSQRSKAACELLMKPMICWVEDACRAAGIEEVSIVAGKDHQLLRKAVSASCTFFVQDLPLGTADAVRVAADILEAGGDLLVLCADQPLVDAMLINDSYQQHIQQNNAVTFITTEQKADVKLNAGIYWFDAAFLADALSGGTEKNSQGEYDLSDVVALAVQKGLSVGGYIAPDTDLVVDANDRRGLQRLNEIARRREIERHLDNGVDIPLTDGVIIGAGVKIAPDVQILPGTILLGNTEIGAGAVIGPNSHLINAKVGAGSKIIASYLTDSTVGADASIGPFSQLRPNSHLGDGVKVGDFVEIKNSTIGEKTSIAHLTYIGDSDVGKLCNFGCGVVTANYNGKQKFRTEIGDRAFVGCNTNLISPVRIGNGAYTAAGTTVAEDLPDGALAIGRPRPQIKEGWADRNIGFKK